MSLNEAPAWVCLLDISTKQVYTFFEHFNFHQMPHNFFLALDNQILPQSPPSFLAACIRCRQKQCTCCDLCTMEEQAINFKMPSKPYYLHTVASIGVFLESFICKVGKKGSKYIYNVEIVHFSKLNIQPVT